MWGKEPITLVPATVMRELTCIVVIGVLLLGLKMLPSAVSLVAAVSAECSTCSLPFAVAVGPSKG